MITEAEKKLKELCEALAKEEKKIMDLDFELEDLSTLREHLLDKHAECFNQMAMLKEMVHKTIMKKLAQYEVIVPMKESIHKLMDEMEKQS